MSHSLAEPPRLRQSPAEPDRRQWNGAITAAGFLLVWLEVFHHLHHEWSLNPQYSYGWSVPLLAIFLCYRRWLDRPSAEPPAFKSMTLSLIAFLALLLLPARIISIANPDWRLLSWLLALFGILISFCGLNLAGGRPWLRHFAFPVLFLLIATPWPAQFEQRIVLGLMHADAAVVIQVLNAIGTVALQRGNVIELSTGLVGIDDACTGVRSLQSTFMISLFLGEFYRLSIARRLVLVLAAAALAFICNIVRTLILCLVAATSGVDAIHTWHDSAGVTILLACVVGLWLMSGWLAQKHSLPASPSFALARGALPALRATGLALASWILFTEISAAAWYHLRGADQAEKPAWSAAWPENEKGFRFTEVPQAAKELLLYNEGGGASWTGEDGHSWLMFYFRWLPGRTAALFVKNHRPDICLPASGLTLREQTPLRVLSIHGIQLPFRVYRFEGNGQNLDVFYCYWDGRSSYADDETALKEDWSAAGRLQAAWKGQREIGARMVEVAVWGYRDETDARAALLRQLDTLITPR